MLYSDWLKIRTQNQVNIPPKLIWGEDVNLVQQSILKVYLEKKQFDFIRKL